MVHHYLAQIALEIARANVKEPNKLKLENFLLKFEKATPAEKEVSDEVYEAQVASKKAFWGVRVGVIIPPGGPQGAENVRQAGVNGPGDTKRR